MLNSPVDEIKSKLSVEEVISGYLELQRAGRNLKARCPFHNEKTPSFMVSPERQMWHCFGCNEGGDIFTFIMKIEGVEFRDALKLLAEKAGVQLKSINFKERGKKEKIFEILEMSKKLYCHFLKINAGRKAYNYLRERGLSGEIIDKFELGYAPNSWDFLSKFLEKKGYSEKDIFTSGLTIRKENGGYYDRFRGRIMFPINNISGKTVGFSGRVMPGQDEAKAKYINTPETLVYNKSGILFGLDKAKLAIREKDLCIVIEGNMDVIASFQAGVENAAAVSGTALTKDQINIIQRYTNNIAFAFDVDLAGIKAAKKGIDLALEEGVNVSVIQVPEGKDPADCVKQNPALWRKTAENPKQVMDFYFENAFLGYDPNKAENKKKIAKELLEVIAKISNKIEQVHYLQVLAGKLKVDEKILAEIIASSKKKRNFRTRTNSDEKSEKKLNLSKRENQLQERLLGLVILYPEIFHKQFLDLEELFSDENFKEIYSLIKDLFVKKGKLETKDLKAVKEYLNGLESIGKEGRGLNFIWDEAAFRLESGFDEISNSVSKESRDCISSLKKIKIQKELKKLETDIKNAEEESDYESQKLLAVEFNKRVKELGELG